MPCEPQLYFAGLAILVIVLDLLASSVSAQTPPPPSCIITDTIPSQDGYSFFLAVPDWPSSEEIGQVGSEYFTGELVSSKPHYFFFDLGGLVEPMGSFGSLMYSDNAMRRGRLYEVFWAGSGVYNNPRDYVPWVAVVGVAANHSGLSSGDTSSLLHATTLCNSTVPVPPTFFESPVSTGLVQFGSYSMGTLCLSRFSIFEHSRPVGSLDIDVVFYTTSSADPLAYHTKVSFRDAETVACASDELSPSYATKTNITTCTRGPRTYSFGIPKPSGVRMHAPIQCSWMETYAHSPPVLERMEHITYPREGDWGFYPDWGRSMEEVCTLFTRANDMTQHRPLGEVWDTGPSGCNTAAHKVFFVANGSSSAVELSPGSNNTQPFSEGAVLRVAVSTGSCPWNSPDRVHVEAVECEGSGWGHWYPAGLLSCEGCSGSIRRGVARFAIPLWNQLVEVCFRIVGRYVDDRGCEKFGIMSTVYRLSNGLHSGTTGSGGTIRVERMWPHASSSTSRVSELMGISLPAGAGVESVEVAVYRDTASQWYTGEACPDVIDAKRVFHSTSTRHSFVNTARARVLDSESDADISTGFAYVYNGRTRIISWHEDLATGSISECSPDGIRGCAVVSVFSAVSGMGLSKALWSSPPLSSAVGTGTGAGGSLQYEDGLDLPLLHARAEEAAKRFPLSPPSMKLGTERALGAGKHSAVLADFRSGDIVVVWGENGIVLSCSTVTGDSGIPMPASCGPSHILRRCAYTYRAEELIYGQCLSGGKLAEAYTSSTSFSGNTPWALAALQTVVDAYRGSYSSTILRHSSNGDVGCPISRESLVGQNLDVSILGGGRINITTNDWRQGRVVILGDQGTIPVGMPPEGVLCALFKSAMDELVSSVDVGGLAHSPTSDPGSDPDAGRGTETQQSEHSEMFSVQFDHRTFSSADTINRYTHLHEDRERMGVLRMSCERIVPESATRDQVRVCISNNISTQVASSMWLLDGPGNDRWASLVAVDFPLGFSCASRHQNRLMYTTDTFVYLTQFRAVLGGVPSPWNVIQWSSKSTVDTSEANHGEWEAFPLRGGSPEDDSHGVVLLLVFTDGEKAGQVRTRGRRTFEIDLSTRVAPRRDFVFEALVSDAELFRSYVAVISSVSIGQDTSTGPLLNVSSLARNVPTEVKVQIAFIPTKVLSSRVTLDAALPLSWKNVTLTANVVVTRTSTRALLPGNDTFAPVGTRSTAIANLVYPTSKKHTPEEPRSMLSTYIITFSISAVVLARWIIV